MHRPHRRNATRGWSPDTPFPARTKRNIAFPQYVRTQLFHQAIALQDRTMCAGGGYVETLEARRDERDKHWALHVRGLNFLEC